MRKLKSIVLLAVFLSACVKPKPGETPSSPPRISDPWPELAGISSSALGALIKHICAKEVACFTGLKSQSCVAGVLATENIDTEIGLRQGRYESLRAVLMSELNGEIRGDGELAMTCAKEFEAFACDDPRLVRSYQADAESPFAGLAEALPLSCSGIFSEDHDSE